VVPEAGIEPAYTLSESVVLPLDDSGIWSARRESNPLATAWKAEAWPLRYTRLLNFGAYGGIRTHPCTVFETVASTDWATQAWYPERDSNSQHSRSKRDGSSNWSTGAIYTVSMFLPFTICSATCEAAKARGLVTAVNP
jgi:hypothetical protein